MGSHVGDKQAAGAVTPSATTAPPQRRPRVAAIVTAYFPQSHADVVITKLIKGYTTDDGFVAPSVDIVSLYMDQCIQPPFDDTLPLELQAASLSTPGGRNPRDIGEAIASEHGIPIYSTIRRALYEGDHHYASSEKPTLDIDGVVMIGEHGDYPNDELGRTLYPQRYFFEQIAGVFAEAGKSVPVYNDKHYGTNMVDAQWIMDRAQKLSIPMMAGSSLPVCWRRPNFEYRLGEPHLEEVACLVTGGVSFGFGGDGWHAMEAVQSMVERRFGGESGIAEVRYLEGDAVWAARAADEFSAVLMEAARDFTRTRPGDLAAGDAAVGKDGDSKPGLVLLRYSDGMKLAMLLIPNVILPDPGQDDPADGTGTTTLAPMCSFAAREAGGAISGCEFTLGGPVCGHFGYLSRNIEQMMLAGKSPYDARRTLLTTGVFDYVLVGRGEGSGRAIATPDLAKISYTSFRDDEPPARPTGPTGRPSGPSMDSNAVDDNWTTGGGRWRSV
jgi:hypothetical protein